MPDPQETAVGPALFLPPSRPSRFDLLIAKPEADRCYSTVIVCFLSASTRRCDDAAVSIGPLPSCHTDRKCDSPLHFIQWGQLIRVNVAVKEA